MTYEITYKKISDHTIDLEADSISQALEFFLNYSTPDLETRERITNAARKVVSVCEEEI